MHSHLSRVVAVFVFSLLALLLIVNTPDAKAAIANNVLISEISISGFSASDEFVELYNPTESDIVLDSWRLTRKTSTGVESNLVSSLSATIKSHGYLLIVPQSGYMGLVPGDTTYSIASAPLASNNTVLLYSDNGQTLVDKVGYGTAVDYEGSASANPIVGEGLERKANSSSTVFSMVEGTDATMGNGEDTDNNLNDFVIRVVAQPQNSTSSIEPVPTLSPTATETPTATPTSTETPTPTVTPTDVPSPTETPTPTVTANPTPTDTPTVTPTVTNTPTPANTITPTMAVSPTPVAIFPTFKLVCTTKNIQFNILTIQFSVPLVSCNVIKL